MTDTFALDRFVDAQRETFDSALAEIRAGRKRGHWMWFIFPQLAGLGHSPTARFYAIGSLAEARAYLAHPLLGARLQACVAGLTGSDAVVAFGAVDAMKLRSSLTLFAEAGGGAAFETALAHWFGERDAATIALLARAG